MDIFSQIQIVQKKPDFLIINKPSGLIVHPNAYQKTATLTDWLKDKFPEINKVGEDEKRPGIVHRLDQDVSGLLVVARNNQTFFHLKKLFQKRKVEKKYYGLIYGHLPQRKGEINLPIGRSKKEPGKFKIRHDQSGKNCLTIYQVIRQFPKHSLLDIGLKTGRTHQIRVHLKGIGHSLVGDPLYKSKGTKTDLDRIFLHAYQLGFVDRKGHNQQAKIALPEKLDIFLQKLDRQ